MQEVVMQTSELSSTREAIEIGVKIIDSTYANTDIDKVNLATVQLDKNQHKIVLSLLTEFAKPFNITLG